MRCARAIRTPPPRLGGYSSVHANENARAAQSSTGIPEGALDLSLTDTASKLHAEAALFSELLEQSTVSEGAVTYPRPKAAAGSCEKRAGGAVQHIRVVRTAAPDDFTNMIWTRLKSLVGFRNGRFPEVKDLSSYRPEAERKSYIGAYKVGEERRTRVQIFLKKRAQRLAKRKVLYPVRQTVANSRPRVGGRFVAQCRGVVVG